MMIYNGNRTERSAIWAKIIRVISKSNKCAAQKQDLVVSNILLMQY